MSKTFSASDVSSHNKPDSLYIIVDEDVYDLTKFQDDHPGEQTLGKEKSIAISLRVQSNDPLISASGHALCASSILTTNPSRV